jgi:hypothetical protein
MATKEECRLCAAIQSVPQTELVKNAVTNGELSLETLMTGMRDSMLLGWAMRTMQHPHAADSDTLCDDHLAQVRELTTEDSEGV